MSKQPSVDIPNRKEIWNKKKKIYLLSVFSQYYSGKKMPWKESILNRMSCHWCINSDKRKNAIRKVSEANYIRKYVL